ncbi:hypothetical protein BDN72DRAFT_475267 [Pluteus cervinus]|uniref:Uncharacterized protein n=1 Tax=Pluteus cervinus TaxID=181527 RepID=A0ACD3AZS9_9AGAR|nr:hypothetical protein BDN72DRAFT_475267 [Pluteus cervinus]
MNFRIIILIVLHCIAMLSTIFRLLHRFRIRQLWWDDLWAGIAMIAAAFLIPLLQISPVYGPGNTNLSLAIKKFSRWSTLFIFTTVLWASRVSIGIMILRMLPPSGMRRIAQGALFGFAAMVLALVIQQVFICGKVSKPVISCPIPRSTGILQLCTNIIADTWLLGAPIYLLVHMKLPSGHKRLLACILATSILTTAVGITHCVFILLHEGRKVGINAHLEVSNMLSVFCATLQVAISCLHLGPYSFSYDRRPLL